MGISGKKEYGISSYFGITNRKRKLLTKEFLETFKEKIINIYTKDAKRYGRDITDFNNETYHSFYSQVEGTHLFYDALEAACKKHNITKAIYNYALRMIWYDRDCFESDLVLEMVHKGVIDETNEYWEDVYNYDESKYLKARYKLVQKNKDYNIIEYGYWDDKNRDILEDIYSDGPCELIWLS